MGNVKKALELLRSGEELSTITAAAGYETESDAAAALVQELDLIASALTAQNVRTLETTRIDAAIRAIWPDVMLGDLRAVDRLLKLMERRSRFLGLDAPTKQEVSGPDGEPIRVEDARAFLAEAIARVAADSQPVAESEGVGEPPG